ncbi:hypothetical protein ACTJKO_07570 [Curtobacterium sp. 22159]|uniref:hypothetical protein n=1 Tax=Curtobacterium sp. 22159 TaxID=3453882 RepID=UPI003F868CBF
MTRFRKWFTQSNIIIAVAVACLVAVAIAFYGSNTAAMADKDDTIHVQRERISTLLQQNGDLSDAIAQANGKLQANGLPTVAAPTEGAAGPAGSNGHDGRGVAFTLCTATGWAITYTDGETENAGGDCTGATGKTGATGSAGAAGAPGKDGADGVSVTGPAGAAGPAGPAGAPGPAGADGADGKDGTGVASVSCVINDAGTAFRFTLTDGSTQDVDGTCTPDPEPTGTPAP